LTIWLRLDRMKRKKICVNQPCSERTKYGIRLFTLFDLATSA
jgi:hypothetical protein